MSFFKRLFAKKAKTPYKPMQGPGPLQTDEERASVRKKMEGEMTSERERRDSAPKPD